MVEEELLGDKTALRRLVKHIVTFDTGGGSAGHTEGLETVSRGGLSVLSDHRWFAVLRGCSSSGGGGNSSGSNGSGNVSGVSSSSHSNDQDACEDSAALAHITRIHLSARFYLLTKEQGRGAIRSASNKAMEEAKAAVQGLIHPQLPVRANHKSNYSLTNHNPINSSYPNLAYFLPSL